MFERGRDKIGAVLGSESPQGRVTVTTANWLTLTRLLIAPFFWYGFFSHSTAMRIVATVLFALGALSDLWDGQIARRRGQVTAFGDFMDPLADKLLVLSAYWAIFMREEFAWMQTSVLAALLLITLRESGITILRLHIIRGGASLITAIWGKLKTGTQLVALLVSLTLLNVRDILNALSMDSTLLNSSGFYMLLAGLFILSAATSAISGLLYFTSGARKKTPYGLN